MILYWLVETGKPMKSVPDLIDVWFDSGAMPYAQWHFPFENKETFQAKSFPQILLLKVLTRQGDGFIHLHAIGCFII